MKIKNTLLLFSLIALLFSSCKKEEGPTGPAGTNGTNGQNGNANVKAFMFIDPIIGGYAFSDTLPGVHYKSLDSSLMLVYIQDHACGTNWYSVPGMGCIGDYTSRVFTSALDTLTLLNLTLYRPDGSPNTGFARVIRKLRVIIAPASSLLSGKREIDYNDYHEVCRYLNIAE